MNKVDVVIYSKDRACQLDLLLRSIFINFLNVNKVFILEDWSDTFFKAGYDKIKAVDYGLPLCFTKQSQSTFYNELKKIANLVSTEFILPLCDDDVFIRETDITDISKYINIETVGIHFRFSLDLTISYHHGTILPLPKFFPIGEYLKWEWSSYTIPGRWGYPYQAGGLVYKTDFFNYMINNVIFNSPNSLEAAMMSKKFQWNKKYIIAFSHSPIVNISVNKVQNAVNNRGGRDVNYDPIELNKLFLDDKIISTDNLYGMVNNCEFIEIPLTFMEDIR